MSEGIDPTLAQALADPEMDRESAVTIAAIAYIQTHPGLRTETCPYLGALILAVDRLGDELGVHEHEHPNEEEGR